MTKQFIHKLIWVSLFAIAMGFMETSVVVYLRKLYFPEGFGFPLKTIENNIGVTEVMRELATMIMLVGAGMIAGRNKNEKFAWFIFSFGIWDIFYYVFLKVLLGWPDSLLTWDVLFLIPVPWVGPVLAPCIISATMILFAFIILKMEDKGIRIKMGTQAKILAIAGCFVCITSFCWDYFHQASAAGKMWIPGSRDQLFSEISTYVPQKFNWGMFLAGEALILAGIFKARKDSLNNKID